MFFFFKQKTAYEMRISDWSSDVCSSDLEKTYADFEIAFTDAGGHSSAPTPGNPIHRMARAIGRIAAYRFAPMRNELTRASLLLSADRIGGAEIGRASRREGVCT